MAFKASTDEDTLLMYFSFALSLIPLGALKRCEFCDRWFLKIGNKKRLFCSNKCAVNQANRSRRKRIKEENGAKYKKELEEGKKRAEKSYNKKFGGKKREL